MKKSNEPHKVNNGIHFMDYASHYTFAVISGVGSVSFFAYGGVKDKPTFIVAGLGALAMASLRTFNGYFNLKKLKRYYKTINELCEENLELRKQLEEITGA